MGIAKKTIWEEIILDFFETKIPEKDSGLRKARNYINKKNQDIEKESNENRRNRLTKDRDKKLLELSELRKAASRGELKDWLDAASKRNIGVGKRIVKATHPFKFGHSSAPSDGILIEEVSKDDILTTATLKAERAIDIAHNNGNLISISNFLGLSNGETMIFDLIGKQDFSFLEPFFDEKNVPNEWKTGFSNLIEDRPTRTAEKLKQVYFPVDGVESYHLLVPLLSSSIAHCNFLVLNSVRYGKDQKELRKAADDDKPYFKSDLLVQYPKTARIQHGGDNKQNVSMFNQERTGFVDLFDAQPPSWNSQLKPPIESKNWFYRGIPFSSIESDVVYLSEFLSRNERLELSVRDPKKKAWLAKWCNNVISVVFSYTERIHTLPPGWSSTDGIKLPLSQQYFLDPYREDDEFQIAKNESDWQNEVASDFARWLNKKLVTQNNKFSPQTFHSKLWRSLMLHKLQKHDQELQVIMSATKGLSS